MYIYLHAICVLIASSFGCKIERSRDRFLDGFVLVAYIELPSCLSSRESLPLE